MIYDLISQVYSHLKEILPDCLIIFISLNAIYFSLRFLKRFMFGCRSSSSLFEDIAEIISDIVENMQESNLNKSSESKSIYYEIEEITISEEDKPYNINLSKDNK